MNFNAYAGQRVLYKNGGKGWAVGELAREGAHIYEDGLAFDIYDKNIGNVNSVKIKNIFFDTRELEPWETNPNYGTVYSKEDFIKKIEEEELTENDGTAYMSDGEYQYYSVPRLNERWIMSQPFDYIVWVN